MAGWTLAGCGREHAQYDGVSLTMLGGALVASTFYIRAYGRAVASGGTMRKDRERTVTKTIKNVARQQMVCLYLSVCVCLSVCVGLSVGLFLSACLSQTDRREIATEFMRGIVY